MYVALRSYITTSVAIIGASVLVAAPVAQPTHGLALPQHTLAVEPMSLASDLLDDVAVIAQAVGTTAYLIAQIPVVMPRTLAKVIADASDNPRDIPGLLSFMAHCVLLPEPYADYGGEFPLLYRLTAPTISALATILPPPLGSGPGADEPGLVLTAWSVVSDIIKRALALLPEAVIPPPQHPLNQAQQPARIVITDPGALVGVAKGATGHLQAAGHAIAAIDDAVSRPSIRPRHAVTLTPRAVQNSQIGGIQRIGAVAEKTVAANGSTDLSTSRRAKRIHEHSAAADSKKSQAAATGA